jgi:hypothetical protein
MDLRLIGEGNIGNLLAVMLINVADVIAINITKGTNMVCRGGVSVVLNAEVHNIYIVPGLGQLEQGYDGGVYSTVVRMVSAGDWTEAGTMVRVLQGKKWLAVTKDTNGLCRLVGTKEQPIRMAVKYSSGDRSRVFEFKSTGYREALYMQGFTPADIWGDGEFSTEFSTEFNS